MPIMATTTNGSGSLIPNLTINPGSIYYNGAIQAKVSPRGALDFLKNKVNRFIDANDNNNDPLTNGNYNSLVPLPPLQIFWSDLGSRSFFLKHKTKSIVTLDNGKTDFENDYTDFWYENVVNNGSTAGLVQVAKAMADNLNYLQSQEKYKNIYEYWG